MMNTVNHDEGPPLNDAEATAADERVAKRPQAKTSRTPKANQVRVDLDPGKSRAHAMARAVHEPLIRHAAVASGFGSGGFTDQKPGITDSMSVLKGISDQVRSDDLKTPTDMLTLQALTLDSIFTELARRASLNMGQFPDAADMYMRLALKAQAQSRSTVEALAKLVRGNEQVVRHVYVDNRGGQAVIAETVNTGGGNGKTTDQSCGPAISGAFGPALLSEDPEGHGLPVSGDAREKAISDTRRKKPGGTQGQQERP